MQVPGGGGIYNSVSTGPFHKVNACTNAHKSVLFNALKTAGNDRRVFENLEVYHAGTRRREIYNLVSIGEVSEHFTTLL